MIFSLTACPTSRYPGGAFYLTVREGVGVCWSVVDFRPSNSNPDASSFVPFCFPFSLPSNLRFTCFSVFSVSTFTFALSLDLSPARPSQNFFRIFTLRPLRFPLSGLLPVESLHSLARSGTLLLPYPPAPPSAPGPRPCLPRNAPRVLPSRPSLPPLVAPFSISYPPSPRRRLLPYT